MGVPVEAVVCSLKDERGLRAAMSGVDAVFHLASAEQDGSRADLSGVDIEGSRTVAQIAGDAGVKRLFFLSHLGADRASAFPVLKAKGIAERFILTGGAPYTIFRTAIVFGKGDHFTSGLARLIKASPIFFLIPGDGTVHIQPILVDDLVTSMILAMEDPGMANQIYHIGGPEFLTFRNVVDEIAKVIHVKRIFIDMSPAYLRLLGIWVEHSWKNFPVSVFLQDYLAADRTCELDTLPRLFGLMPERMGRNLDYLD